MDKKRHKWRKGKYPQLCINCGCIRTKETSKLLMAITNIFPYNHYKYESIVVYITPCKKYYNAPICKMNTKLPESYGPPPTIINNNGIPPIQFNATNNKLYAYSGCWNEQVSKTLLEKYIKYVNEVEGTDFIENGYKGYGGDTEFTAEEWEVLKEISKKIKT